MVASIPVIPLLELWAVRRDRRGVRNGALIWRLSRRHLQRASGRFIGAWLSLVVGFSALRSPTMLPTTPAGWAVLICLFALPVYFFQIDGIMDLLLRRDLPRLAAQLKTR
jgi:hypothetical protein